MESAFQQIDIDGLLPGYTMDVDYADTGCNAIKGLGRSLSNNSYLSCTLVMSLCQVTAVI